MTDSLRDGCVRIDTTGEVIRPGMDAADFRALAFVTGDDVRGGTYGGAVNLGVQRVCGRAFHVSVAFRKGRVARVQLACCFDHSTEPWAYEVEIERKRLHEAWCAEQLGEPLAPMPGFPEDGKPEERLLERRYPWGSLQSIYDGRGGSSFLRITYDGAGE